MKAQSLAALLALVLGATAASAAYDAGKAQLGGMYMELHHDPAPVAGGWEYVIDFYTGGDGSQDYAIWGVDFGAATNIDQNVDTTVSVPYSGTYNLHYDRTFMQFWDWQSRFGWTDCFSRPTYDTNSDNVWEVTSYPWSIDNPWHTPSEYADGWEQNHNELIDAGGTVTPIQNFGPSVASEDVIHIGNHSWGWGHDPGLWFTIRVVSSDPLDSLTWSMPSYGDGDILDPDSVWFDQAEDLIDKATDWNTTGAQPGDPNYGVPDGTLDTSDWQPGQDGIVDGVDLNADGVNDIFHAGYGIFPVLGNFSGGVPGDFTGEGDVNAADIDMLADAIALGTYDATFDVNNDSFLDEQDLIDHIATLVERTGGVGTYRGDFNLDGYVDGTDLAILKAGFGLTGLGYALGNCNSDDFVDGTDLAIFKATFGFSGTPDPTGVTNPPAVPEPATMALLSLGAAALLRRRKK